MSIDYDKPCEEEARPVTLCQHIWGEAEAAAAREGWSLDVWIGNAIEAMAHGVTE